MLIKFVDMIVSWHPFLQLVLVCCVATLMTAMTMHVMAIFSRFMNTTLSVLIRGWPPAHAVELLDDGGDSPGID